jgi:haloacetate dehalogenase
MGNDIVALMRSLGHERFALAGHDRGNSVSYRTALDHPEAIRKLVIMDGVPLLEAVERCNAKFAAAWWHWWFFAQSDKPAERFINRDPEAWYGSGSLERMGPDGHADWQAAISNPATVHAMLEDYRAGVTIDCDNDRADRDAGRKIGCPTLFLYSEQDDMVELYGDPLSIWRNWAGDVRDGSVDCGHHIAEEAPEELARILVDFLRD